MSEIILSQIPLSDLISQLREVVRQEIISAAAENEAEKMISPAEACKLFNPSITRPTLDKLVNEGKLQKHYVGSRVYFKKSDVFTALKSFKKYDQAGK